MNSRSPPGIEFEECYKEYLPGYIKSRNGMDAVNAFYRPANAFPSPMTTAAVAGPLLPTPGTGLLGVPPSYSNPQNGFKNALDLATLPQTGMSNINNHGFDISLTQPVEPYHSGNPFPGEFRYNSSTQFDFPMSSHPPSANTTSVGGGQIPELLPPVANNTSIANPDVPSGMSATGSSFTQFFPALLSENPLSGGTPQEVVSSEGGEKSVTDLFNLTAGLDLPADFENPLGLGSGVQQEERAIIGTAVVNKDNESTWSQSVDNKMEPSEHSGVSSKSSTLRVNEKGPAFVHSSSEMNVGEDSSNHGLGRMDSFGFSTSASSSEMHGFGTNNSSVHNTTADNAAAAITGDPNWPDYIRVPNSYLPSAFGSGQAPTDTSSNNNGNNDGEGEMDLPRMPNTEPFVLGKSVPVGVNQNAVAGSTTKLSPKGKKKKKRGSSKSLLKETITQGVVENSNISIQPQESSNASAKEEFVAEADVSVAEELVGIEGHRKPRNMDYDLSSASTPTLQVLSSIPGFRSEGHTPPPPTTDDITVDTPFSSANVLEPFADIPINNSGKDGVLHEERGGSDVTNTSGIQIQHPILSDKEIDDVFDSQFREPSAFSDIDSTVESKGSVLWGSILAARASKEHESDTGVQIGTPDPDDVPVFKSFANLPVFERIKDIEDDSSQESEKEVLNEPSVADSVAPIESASEAVPIVDVESSDISTKDIPETFETALDHEQVPSIQPEVIVPNTTNATEYPEPVLEEEEVFLKSDISPFSMQELVSEHEAPDDAVLLKEEMLLKSDVEVAPVHAHEHISEQEIAVHTPSAGMLVS